MKLNHIMQCERLAMFCQYIWGYYIYYLIAMYFHSVSPGIALWIIYCTVPFIFQKKMKSIFTRDVLLEFNEQYFLTCEYNHKGKLVKESTFKWTDIEGFKCYISQSNISF